ncbi:MAG TPA: TrkH family potassium uptake protein, partial [Proteobacteria bacterium]|nr:TrkH family potassium uptake protein [Pseudomonadota bacterium]
VLRDIGSLLIVLGGFLLLSAASVFIFGESRTGLLTFFAFIGPGILSILLGVTIRRYLPPGDLNRLQAMLVCSLGWIVFSLIGALPFVIALDVNYLDAVFETMSGFTTTGITVFIGLDRLPKSILFWRSLTQWIGGLGILTFFLAISFQGSNTHRLFGAESHKIDVGRPVPGVANTLKILWGIYILFTALIGLGLIISGMGIFDSICQSFTALSTGGFSPHDASIGYYRLSGFPHYIAIEYIIILGMLLGGTNFLIHYRLLIGKFKSIYTNTELRYWFGFIAIFIVIIIGERAIHLQRAEVALPENAGYIQVLERNFRTVTFQVVSIITTTGFATRDIGDPYFGTVARQLFLVMMVIGGCVGSTSGGFKVLRAAIMVKSVRREVFRLRAPRSAVSSSSVDGKPVNSDEVRRVGALFFAWITLLAAGGIITALFSDLPGISSFSGMFSALGNIGPCYIPGSDIPQLNPVIKITYIFGMLAGRLEIIPVLLLFSRKAWRS